jgi:hypothetical protein
MKARLLALAILSTASAATFAGGLFHSDQDRTSGPNARVPDNAVAVTPAAPVVVAPAPDTSASADASAYATPANPPVVVTEPAVVATAPVWVTKVPAQSGPGTNDKLRPGYPDDANGHSTWDIGTSSAGS